VQLKLKLKLQLQLNFEVEVDHFVISIGAFNGGFYFFNNRYYINIYNFILKNPSLKPYIKL
jgi:hypothetical protein